MVNLEVVQGMQALMMEHMRTFREMIEELKDDRGLSNDDFSKEQDEDAMIPEEDLSDKTLQEQTIEEALDADDEYKLDPYQMIDPEDPGFWSGKVMPLPPELVIGDMGETRLLPIMYGRFYNGSL